MAKKEQKVEEVVEPKVETKEETKPQETPVEEKPMGDKIKVKKPKMKKMNIGDEPIDKIHNKLIKIILILESR